MTFITTFVFAAALWPNLLAAQQFKMSANPVSDTVRQLLARDSRNLIASAQLMPADKYSYRPTPAQMTFGQLIVHIVQTNVALCSGISGNPASVRPDELEKLSDTDAKEALVGAIKRSFDYCTEALAADIPPACGVGKRCGLSSSRNSPAVGRLLEDQDDRPRGAND